MKRLIMKCFNYIIDLRSKDPTGVTKSNFKGWHSKNFDLKKEEP
jgi:hypothetical protein